MKKEKVKYRMTGNENRCALRSGICSLRKGNACPLHVSLLQELFPLLPFLLSLLFLLSGCLAEDISDEKKEAPMGILRFELSADGPSRADTRSTVNESTINDIHLLVYNADNVLIGHKYFTSPTGSPVSLQMTVRAGSGYTVYGIANTGNSGLFSSSAVATKAGLEVQTTALLSSYNDIGNGSYLLMSGSATNLAVNASSSGSASACSLSLKRLAAKVTLNVSIVDGSGITLSGYRIYGLPRKSYYIAHPLVTTEEIADDTNTSRAMDACLPASSGDWTDSGQITLSNVTSFNTSFYMYENRAGVNSSITAQKNKIKANAPGTPADSAAYVVIYGKGTGYSSLSWKIYLGTNNTSNFNMKRNWQYTYTIKLKVNESDTRITYKKSSIWAGSNLYWDGTKLTFDIEETAANNKKQGVFFMWGSLIGISPNGANNSSYGSSVVLYIPPSGGTLNSGTSWTNTTTGSSMGWTTKIPYMTSGNSTDQTNTYLNDAAQNTDDNYKAYVGDICQYLSKTGAVSGSWRMPTVKELNTTNTNAGGGIGWGTTGTTTWANYGTYPGTSSGNADGQTPISWGAVYTVNGVSTSFPASGCRNYDNGTLIGVGQSGYCWSSSSNGTYAFSLAFYNSFVLSANYYYRQYGLPVRCVRN
jgi:hypothetical protein